MIPDNSKEATQFVVSVISNREGIVEKETFVFSASTNLKEIYAKIFENGFNERRAKPFSIELAPDLNCLPTPLTLMENVFQMLQESDAPDGVPF